jgi:PAS domain S-box-containing protein
LIIEAKTKTQLMTLAGGEQQLLRNLIDNLPDGIYIKDTESRFVIANTTVANLIGVTSPDELIGKTDFDFFTYDLASKYYADEQEVIKSGQPLLNQLEPTFDFRTGQQGWLLTTKVIWLDGNGDVAGIMGMGRNITELKQAQDALEQAQRELEYRVEDRTMELSNLNSKLEGTLKLYSSTLDHIRNVIVQSGVKTELLIYIDQTQKRFQRVNETRLSS